MGILDQVTLQFIHTLQRDAAIIQASSKMLFYYLVLIQLTVSALWMIVSGESFDRFIVKLVQLAIAFGVFYALIQFGGEWVPEIINGFIELGQRTGVQSLDPSSIVSQGVSISGAILKGFFNWGLLSHPFVSLVGAVVCIAVLVLYGLIAAELTIVLVKSYIVIAVGGLFFAFGGSDYTREMTKRYFQATIGLGLQLMTLYMLLGVGQHVGSAWAGMTANAAKQHQLMPMLVILCAVIVYYMILKNIPPFIAGLSGVGGFRNYGDAAVGMAINAGMGGAQLLARGTKLSGVSVQGLGQLGATATHLSQHFSSSNGSLSKAGLANVASHAGKASANVMSASGNTVRDWMMKRNTQFSVGQKFNHHLANKLRTNIGGKP